MDCHGVISPGVEYARFFKQKAIRERIPITGSMDVSRRCNFRCVHCYLSEEDRNSGPELSTDQVKKHLDSMVEAGCLYLLISGGEPLFRKDFKDIYRHARSKGLVITVFTNASCVEDDHVRLFREMPPSRVEVSVYGASPETYERVTGISGSFERCMDGIDRLWRGGIRMGLKTIVMDINCHALKDMERMARERGVPFRFDGSIMARLNGDKAPLSHRITPEAIADLEFEDPGRAEGWKTFWNTPGKMLLDDGLYMCGAGQASFHVSADGFLQPCMMCRSPRWDLGTGTFQDGWAHMARIQSRRVSHDHSCRGCALISLCGYCPPLFELEKGSEHVCPDFVCRLGNARYQKIMNSGGINDSEG